MKPLYDRKEHGEKTDIHKTDIKCIKCGKTGFADAEFCPSCGAKYPLKAVIMDIDMRFTSMIMFMIKGAFAAIPAIFIIFVLAILPFSFILMILMAIFKR